MLAFVKLDPGLPPNRPSFTSRSPKKKCTRRWRATHKVIIHEQEGVVNGEMQDTETTPSLLFLKVLVWCASFPHPHPLSGQLMFAHNPISFPILSDPVPSSSQPQPHPHPRSIPCNVLVNPSAPSHKYFAGYSFLCSCKSDISKEHVARIGYNE